MTLISTPILYSFVCLNMFGHMFGIFPNLFKSPARLRFGWHFPDHWSVLLLRRWGMNVSNQLLMEAKISSYKVRFLWMCELDSEVCFLERNYSMFSSQSVPWNALFTLVNSSTVYGVDERGDHWVMIAGLIFSFFPLWLAWEQRNRVRRFGADIQAFGLGWGATDIVKKEVKITDLAP